MYIKLNTISLFYETFGNPNHTPLLLIMGAGSQGVLWPDDFCKLLSQHNLYVIRYDHRDTGLSTCVNYEDHPYNFDVAEDDKTFYCYSSKSLSPKALENLKQAEQEIQKRLSSSTHVMHSIFTHAPSSQTEEWQPTDKFTFYQ